MPADWMVEPFLKQHPSLSVQTIPQRQPARFLRRQDPPVGYDRVRLNGLAQGKFRGVPLGVYLRNAQASHEVRHEGLQIIGRLEELGVVHGSKVGVVLVEKLLVCCGAGRDVSVSGY